MRGNEDDVRAFLFSLPECITGLNAKAFGLFGFSQDDAAPFRGIAAYSDGSASERGVSQHFDARKTVIDVAV